jgi:membrane protein YdbS with pleckstrin-like domain
MKNGLLAAFVERPHKMRFETQTHDEEVVLLLRRHWFTNLPWITLTLVMLLVPPLISRLAAAGQLEALQAIPSRFQLVGGLVWYVFTLGLAFESFTMWYFNVLLITDRRIVDIDFFGLLHKSVAETPLNNVQDVTHDVGGFWRVVFNFGDVYVQTAAEVPRIEFNDIPRPNLVHQKIAELIQHRRR